MSEHWATLYCCRATTDEAIVCMTRTVMLVQASQMDEGGHYPTDRYCLSWDVKVVIDCSIFRESLIMLCHPFPSF